MSLWKFEQAAKITKNLHSEGSIVSSDQGSRCKGCLTN